MGDDADFLACEGEAVAALARQQAEHGFTDSSSNGEDKHQQPLMDENEA
jgi:hypothetical protein